MAGVATRDKQKLLFKLSDPDGLLHVRPCAKYHSNAPCGCGISCRARPKRVPQPGLPRPRALPRPCAALRLIPVVRLLQDNHVKGPLQQLPKQSTACYRRAHTIDIEAEESQSASRGS